MQEPLQFIKFIDKKTKSDSAEYSAVYSSAKECTSILEIVTSQNNKQ